MAWEIVGRKLPCRAQTSVLITVRQYGAPSEDSVRDGAGIASPRARDHGQSLEQNRRGRHKDELPWGCGGV